MSSETILILPTQPEDAEAVRRCGDRAFTGTSFRERIFPQRLKHLTTPEDETKWRADSLRKQLKAGDMVHFKCVPENDHSKVVGYSVWYRPGHFTKDKSLAAGLMGQKDAATKSEPQSDLTAQEGPDGAKPPVTEGEAKEESPFPPFMDVEVYKKVTSKMDDERRKIWGDDAKYWYLGGLAVEPEYQRRGLARRMIDMGLEWADEDGVPTYLESSPDAATVYPKFGFKNVGEYPFFDGTYVCQFHIRQPGATTPSKQGYPKP